MFCTTACVVLRSDMAAAVARPGRPAYMTRERIEMAPNLKMCVTCGIGSDHVDLEAAMERNIAVTEETPTPPRPYSI